MTVETAKTNETHSNTSRAPTGRQSETKERRATRTTRDDDGQRHACEHGGTRASTATDVIATASSESAAAAASCARFAASLAAGPIAARSIAACAFDAWASVRSACLGPVCDQNAGATLRRPAPASRPRLGGARIRVHDMMQ